MGTNRFGSKLDIDKAAIISAKALFNENGADGLDLSNLDLVENEGEIEQAYGAWKRDLVSEEEFKIILVENGLDAMIYTEDDLEQEVLDALEARRRR